MSLEVIGCEYEVRPDQRVIDVDVITETSAVVRMGQAHSVITSASVGPQETRCGRNYHQHSGPIVEVPFHKEVTGVIELPEDGEPIGKVLDVDCTITVPPVEVTQGAMQYPGNGSGGCHLCRGRRRCTTVCT